MVVAADDVAEGRQPLLDALDLDLVWNAVAQVLQLLIAGRRGHEQAFAVAGGEAADDAGSGNGGVADGYYVLQFGFEDRVEVFRGADGDEGVAVGQGCEDSDSARGKRGQCLVLPFLNVWQSLLWLP